jgi:hypothetical protein
MGSSYVASTHTRILGERTQSPSPERHLGRFPIWESLQMDRLLHRRTATPPLALEMGPKAARCGGPSELAAGLSTGEDAVRAWQNALAASIAR